jgi:hypothetical protein
MNKKEISPLCTLHLNSANATRVFTAMGTATVGKITQTWNVNWSTTLPPEFYNAGKLLCSHEFAPSMSSGLFFNFAGPAARFTSGSSQVWMMYSSLTNSSYNSTQQTSNFLNVATINFIHPQRYYNPTDFNVYGDAACTRVCTPRFFVASNISRSSQIWIDIVASLYTTANWGSNPVYTEGIHTFKFYSVIN